MNLFKNNHANQRFFERVDPDKASKKDIVKAVQNPLNIEYIKKLTDSRSTAYVHLPNNEIVKVILNKKKKEIVTILPWREIYFVDLTIIMEGDYKYLVKFYPDCYYETKNISTLNKVKSITRNNEIEDIPHNHNEFSKVIDAAWRLYKENKRGGIYDSVDSKEKVKTSTINKTSEPEK